MLKNQIRRKILKLRQKKNSNCKEIEPKNIFRLLKKIKIKKKIIGCYFPVGSELGTKKIMKALESKNFVVSLPVIKGNCDMNFYKYNTGDPLYVNKYGIPEPKKMKKIIPNILLIPLVAFDQNLNRIGYGGGFYDRFLGKVKKNNIIAIGVALSCQLVEKIIVEKFDKKLDFVITEKKIYK